MRKLLIGSIALLLLTGIGFLAIGYQPTVYLMPTPTIIGESDLNPFDLNPKREKSSEVTVLFATNRIPAGEFENRMYTIFPGNNLRMGVAQMQIGKKESNWEKIFNLSTTSNGGQRPALSLEGMKELAKIPVGENGSGEKQESLAFAALVNRVLDKLVEKNITIYVHGANTAVYRATAQAAQYHHFTGQNSLVLAFLWPSAENLFAYGTDTRHALKSAPAFAQLLTYLARYTDAKSINILAYSAGAQIVSPALDILGKTTSSKERKDLRLGEVYFAAPDIGVDTFIKHLQSYIDMPLGTTLSMNFNDSVLRLAALRSQVSRAGNPDQKDLSAKKSQWVQKASMGRSLTLLKVSSDTVSGMRRRAHDFWFSHPWVSSDVLTQFLFHKSPGERGLTASITDDGIRVWTFPPDYPEQIIDIVERHEIRGRMQQ